MEIQGAVAACRCGAVFLSLSATGLRKVNGKGKPGRVSPPTADRYPKVRLYQPDFPTALIV
jgi:hypothetical protein